CPTVCKGGLVSSGICGSPAQGSGEGRGGPGPRPLPGRARARPSWARAPTEQLSIALTPPARPKFLNRGGGGRCASLAIPGGERRSLSAAPGPDGRQDPCGCQTG